MIPLEVLTVCLSGSMHTSLAALFAGVFVSMELRHFVCISDATVLFGFLAVGLLYVPGVRSVCDGLGVRIHSCSPAYYITACCAVSPSC